MVHSLLCLFGWESRCFQVWGCSGGPGPVWKQEVVAGAPACPLHILLLKFIWAQHQEALRNTDTYTHIYSHTFIHTLTHTHSHLPTHTFSYTHALTCSHSLTHIRSHHTHSHILTYSEHMHIHSLTHTHTCSHTLLYTCLLYTSDAADE